MWSVELTCDIVQQTVQSGYVLKLLFTSSSSSSSSSPLGLKCTLDLSTSPSIIIKIDNVMYYFFPSKRYNFIISFNVIFKIDCQIAINPLSVYMFMENEKGRESNRVSWMKIENWLSFYNIDEEQHEIDICMWYILLSVLWRIFVLLFLFFSIVAM